MEVGKVRDYDESSIFCSWASDNNIVWTLEDEHALRGGFDEHVASLPPAGW